MRRVSIKDIAADVGVSHPVVSTVLSGGNSTTKVSEKTRKKVLEAAERLGYQRDILSRSFKNQRSYLIGVLLSGVNYRYAADFALGMQEVVSGKDYAPILFTHRTRKQEKAFVQQCLDRRVEGLIVNCAVDADGGVNAKMLAKLAASVPVVEVYGRFIDNAPSVNLGYEDAGRLSVEALLSMGHTKIALFTHDQYLASRKSGKGLYWNAWEHWLGYEKAIKRARKKSVAPVVKTHPLPADLVHPGALYRSAADSVKRIFSGAEPPTALVCLTDEQAEAVLHTIDRQQISVPEDFHIVSFGGYSSIAGSDPRLTTLPEPVEQLGTTAAEMLLELIGGGQAKSVTLPPLSTRGE
jgi:DNA-binding LacI/PurR family transcriptional regulator